MDGEGSQQAQTQSAHAQGQLTSPRRVDAAGAVPSSKVISIIRGSSQVTMQMRMFWHVKLGKIK